jgi:pantoate--beta-alanine ligase
LIKVFKGSAEIHNYLLDLKKQGKKSGFVPTMGALHQGHLSLIKKCHQENDVCITSIFVNPTQFNEKKDFENYPRLLEEDILKLKNNNCQVVFIPTEEEIYPDKDYHKTIIDLGNINKVLEGRHREGHFDGVVTIVKKLFEIIVPDLAYFGQKDFQQYLVIKKIITAFGFNIKLVLCPTIREKDGLAMSSRNLLLTPMQRAIAPKIYETLTMAGKLLKTKAVEEVKTWAEKKLSGDDLMQLEYFELVDPETLAPVSGVVGNEGVLICAAVKTGNIRLIDNILV